MALSLSGIFFVKNTKVLEIINQRLKKLTARIKKLKVTTLQLRAKNPQ